MKDLFQQIVDICYKDTDKDLDLSHILIKARNRIIRYEWEEKYGISLQSNFAEYDYLKLNDYEFVLYYKDGYNCHKEGHGRSISWSEGGKQPVNEWIYSISFGTGSYIFGEDYNGQQQLFQDFFNELRTYKPDYEDLHNTCLYWKIENAKNIMEQFNDIFKKYKEKNRSELKEREIKKLEDELAKLKK